MGFDFKGVGVALVTPFTQAGGVDFDALENLVQSVIAGGADYLVALGTTAETPCLDASERAAVTDCIRRVNNFRLPMVVGIGGNCTSSVVRQVSEADVSCFEAVLSVTPYYNKPSQQGLFQHYAAVAGASPLPVILYNVPGRTGTDLLPETALELARTCPRVAAIKEASGNLPRIVSMIEQAPAGFSVISGDDSLALPVVEAGGAGVISVAANVFTEPFCRMIHDAMQGRTEQAREAFSRMGNVLELLFREGNPSGVKTALAVRGVMRRDVRLPLAAGSQMLFDAFKTEMLERGL